MVKAIHSAYSIVSNYQVITISVAQLDFTAKR